MAKLAIRVGSVHSSDGRFPGALAGIIVMLAAARTTIYVPSRSDHEHRRGGA
jgi:hypothetical protein